MNIEQDLFELQDEKYQKFHSNLCPGVNNIIGVRIPVLRNYAKKINKNIDIWSIKNDYYEEVMLKGMLIGLRKDLNYKDIEKFIPLIDNWAVCDVFCAGLKKVKNNKTKMWDFLLKYVNSTKEFEVRFAIVMILDFFIEEEYIDKVLEILQKVKQQDYYAKMAISWCYSICFIKFYEKTKLYFEQMNEKDKFIYNKSIQKAIESYRLTQKQKEELRKMKI